MRPLHIPPVSRTPGCYPGSVRPASSRSRRVPLQWKRPGEESLLETFAILTTVANEVVAPLHDRMPVILQPDDCKLWLSHGTHDPDQFIGLYKPLPSNLLDAYKVSDLVNNPRFDGASCILPV